MKKADLIAKIAEKSGMTKKDAEKALGTVLESIEEALVAGEKIQLVGFGTFEVKERAGQIGSEPPHGRHHRDCRGQGAGLKAGKNAQG